MRYFTKKKYILHINFYFIFIFIIYFFVVVRNSLKRRIVINECIDVMSRWHWCDVMRCDVLTCVFIWMLLWFATLWRPQYKYFYWYYVHTCMNIVYVFAQVYLYRMRLFDPEIWQCLILVDARISPIITFMNVNTYKYLCACAFALSKWSLNKQKSTSKQKNHLSLCIYFIH